MKRSKQIDIYIISLVVLGLAAVTLRFIALLSFNNETMHFDDKVCIRIANLLTTLGVGIFASGMLFGLDDADLVPSSENAATYIPTGLVAIALMFSVADRAKVLMNGSFADNSTLYYFSIALLILSALSVVAFFILVLISKTQSVIKTYLLLFIVIYLAVYSVYLYFNTTVHPTNSPNKIVDLLAYLFASMFFLFETRIPLGRAAWKPYIAFGFAASLLTAYSALPALIMYIYNGSIISDSICETAVTLALCIFITSRVILTSVLPYDVQCPEAEVISDLAAMRQAEMAESRELSRARNNDNMEEIDSEEVENYQFDIPSEEINANTEAK